MRSAPGFPLASPWVSEIVISSSFCRINVSFVGFREPLFILCKRMWRSEAESVLLREGESDSDDNNDDRVSSAEGVIVLRDDACSAAGAALDTSREFGGVGRSDGVV